MSSKTHTHVYINRFLCATCDVLNVKVAYDFILEGFVILI